MQQIEKHLTLGELADTAARLAETIGRDTPVIGMDPLLADEAGWTDRLWILTGVKADNSVVAMLFPHADLAGTTDKDGNATMVLDQTEIALT